MDLRSITLKIGSGATPRGGKESYKENGITLIRSLNVYDFKFEYDGLAYIDEAQAKELSNVEVKPHDILLNITGASVARCCMVPGKLLPARVNQHVALVRTNQTFVDPFYLLYAINSPQYKHRLLTLAQGGATREALTKETIENFKIPLPPYTTQHKIAAILSAYDDLIENNTRRIAILEEMAQSLYREWFVHFRFPGHEKKRMVESQLGMIPEGWEVKAISEVIETLGGGTPSTRNIEYWNNGHVNWYSPTDLTATGTMFITHSAKKITDLGLDKSSARMFPAYSVMMTSRATIGVIAINTGPACTNQGFITCVPNEKLSAYQIYFWLAENKEKIISLASGATFKEINRATFRKLPIVIPDISTSQEFNELVLPMCKQVENLIAKNANLRRTRDLLLPKLISGEVDVEGLEIAGAEETGEVETKAVEV